MNQIKDYATLCKRLPKWHKIVTDEDLPEDQIEVLVQSVKGTYNIAFMLGVLWYGLNGEELEGVSAWCEIPKYEEE